MATIHIEARKKKRNTYVEIYEVCPDFNSTMTVYVCAAPSYTMGYNALATLKTSSVKYGP
jgi:hypothetical protein